MAESEGSPTSGTSRSGGGRGNPGILRSIPDSPPPSSRNRHGARVRERGEPVDGLVWIQKSLWDSRKFKPEDCFQVTSRDSWKDTPKKLDFAANLWAKGEKKTFLEALMAGRDLQTWRRSGHGTQAGHIRCRHSSRKVRHHRMASTHLHLFRIPIHLHTAIHRSSTMATRDHQPSKGQGQGRISRGILGMCSNNNKKKEKTWRAR
jgi:hypothetical protein